MQAQIVVTLGDVGRGGSECDYLILGDIFRRQAHGFRFNESRRFVLFRQRHIGQFEIGGDRAGKGCAGRVGHDQAAAAAATHHRSAVTLHLPHRLRHGGATDIEAGHQVGLRAEGFTNRPAPTANLLHQLGGDDFAQFFGPRRVFWCFAHFRSL